MGWRKRVLIIGLSVSFVSAAAGLPRADIARELRAKVAEFLSLCLIAERAGLDPAEIERIAAPVVSPGKKPAEEMLRLIGEAEAALRAASPRLEGFIGELEELARRVPIVLFPQCHIDLVWQWDWEETVEISRDTFRAQLELSRSVPDYVYCQDQAALYAAVELADPALFREIQKAVRGGRWRIVGGNWAEIVMEEVTGESVIRNFFYGKRYFLEKFGVDVEVAWQMEGTGLFPSLPQILRDFGFQGAVFGRERPWTDIWRPISRWRGSDGTEIPLVLLYHYGLPPDSLERRALEAIATGWPETPPALAFAFGGGDHGGGPNRTLLARTRAAIRDAGLEARLGDPAAFFSGLDAAELPVVEGVLKMGGVGVATQPRLKRLIRECEHLLLALESLRAVLTISQVDPDAARAVDDLERMWKELLECEFHDSLWGSTSYAPSREVRGRLEDLRDEIRTRIVEALGRLASGIETTGEGIPVVVFNPLPTTRSGVVTLPQVPPDLLQGPLVAVDAAGNAAPVARTGEGLSFVARDVPPTGYMVYRLVRDRASGGARAEASGGMIRLEGSAISAEVDVRTGKLLSVAIRDGPTFRFPGGGLRLEIWRDMGSAWGPNLAERLWTEGDARARPEVRIVARGPAVAAVAVRFPLPGGGWVEREIRVWDGLPWVECIVRGEWTLPRAQLLAVTDTSDTSLRPYTEVPFGAVDWEAEWERRLEGSGVVERLEAVRRLSGAAAEELGYQVPQLRWADICDGERGLAVLNRGLFGVRLRPGSIVLPILRSPPFVEQGEWVIHRQPEDVPVFSGFGPFEAAFALLPHWGDWRIGEVPAAGLAFNLPLLVATTEPHPGKLLPQGLFLSLGGPVLFSCLKPAADGSGDLVLRLYEPFGEGARATIEFSAPVAVGEADMMERSLQTLARASGTVEVDLDPFEITTLRIRPEW